MKNKRPFKLRQAKRKTAHEQKRKKERAIMKKYGIRHINYIRRKDSIQNKLNKNI